MSRATLLGALAFVAVAVAAAFMPAWIVSLATIAFSEALVVLGLIILWRAGLVPFGQALYYAIGAYAVALLGRYGGIHDVFVLTLIAAAAAGIVAWLIGFLLARYREIFFAMLSLAMSMILYGVLVKTETLGSTDGFHVETAHLFGRPASGLVLFWIVLGFSALSAFLVAAYFRSVAGMLAVPIRDNEIRVEFLGISVDRLIHLKLVISGILAGVGGALAALAIAHVDPNMAYWTTSGGFVFVTILAGAGSVAAAFVGSFVFELLRSIAVDIMPGYWQITLGTALLLTILFLPEGLGSIVSRLRRRRHGSAPLTRAGEDVPPDIDASRKSPALVLPVDASGNRAAERVS
jgi:branched-chain amino acid transport system permease protein